MVSQAALAWRTFWATWQAVDRRRGAAVGAAALALLMLALYAVTDPVRLAGHIPLDGADWLGYAVCHRITARSFALFDRQMPLCARCTGMYLGAALTSLAFWTTGRLRRGGHPPASVLAILLGLVAAMGVDGLNSYSHFFPGAPHLYTPQNWLRLLTGMGAGVAMGCLLWPAWAQTVWRRPDPRPIVAGWRELLWLLALAGAGVGLVLRNQPAVLYVLAFVSIGGLLALLAAINTVFGLVLLRRDGRAADWRQAAPALALGLLLATAELITVSAIRYSLTGVMAGLPGL